ncbi:MAG: hypothetical protein ACOYU4_00630 [Thermodesulfobacteriota bacterium]
MPTTKKRKKYSSEFKEEADLEMELRRLRTENKRLGMKREILKKAAAFFVKELS